MHGVTRVAALSVTDVQAHETAPLATEQLLSLRGAGFDGRASVTVDNVQATVVSRSARELTVLVPRTPLADFKATPHTLQVINGDGRGVNATTQPELAPPSMPGAPQIPGVPGAGVIPGLPPGIPLPGAPAAALASTLAAIQATAAPVAAISRNRPNLNAGEIQGSLRVNNGEAFNLNGGFQLKGDLYLPGTPSIRLNGNASHGGVVNDGGAVTPAYNVTLNGNVNLPGKIHIRADALPLPGDIPAAVPASAGARTVNINTAADIAAVGAWATVRDLNVNGANLTVTVPPGNYRKFQVNGSSRLNFTGGTYNFSETVQLNGGSSIRNAGVVVINIGQTLQINGEVVVSGAARPGDVRVNVLGSSVQLNGGAALYALLRAPNAAVTVNGNATLRGQLIAGVLTLNGGGRIIADLSTGSGETDTTPPVIAITAPANNATTTGTAINVSGTASDAGGIASVTVNGTAATYTNGHWTLANVALNLGANTITAVARDNAGNTANASVTITRNAPPDTTPPVIAITAPANNATVTSATISVSGTASDAGGIASVTVNGTAATYTNGNWTLANVALNLGANTITAVARDNAGNTASAVVTVTRNQPPDTTPPVIAITAPANNTTTTGTAINVSGTASDAGGIASVTVNGTAATYTNGNWTLANVALNLGANTITAVARDNAGNTASATVTATRNLPPDTAPPTVAITTPANNNVVTNVATISVEGTADDTGVNASGVNRVTVNGAPATYDPATKRFAAASVPLLEGDNVITAEAEDKVTPVPNRASAQIRVRRRVVPPPVVAVTSPQNNAVVAASTVTLAGTVQSGAPDIPVIVKVNGAGAIVAGGQWTRAVTLAEGANAFAVIATDSLNQTAQAAASVTRDSQAPALSFAAIPAIVRPGAAVALSVSATDNLAIAAVEFSVNGQLIGTGNTAPYEFMWNVPAAAPPNQIFTLTAIARDQAGATASAVTTTRTGGPAGVSGYVFDDATGYVVAGARITIPGSSAMADSDTGGAYSAVSASPVGVARLAKPGYTPVERTFAMRAGESAALFDARLTKLETTVNNIGGAGGQARGDGNRLNATIPAGAVTQSTDVRVTSVSPQGLANLLPFGWSPVPGAVIDLRAADAALAIAPSPIRLTVTNTSGLAQGTALTLARYDEAAHAWVVINNAVIAGTGGALSADVPASGQYAFLAADTGATAPPAAAIGAPLPAGPAADSAVLSQATVTATPSPRTAIVAPDARSIIGVNANAPVKLPSGVTAEVTFDETYDLLAGETLTPDRPAQDFVLYAYPAATVAQPNQLAAQFVARPVRNDLTLAQLRAANIHVEIMPGRAQASGVLLGAGGGAARTSDGAELHLPAGALSADTPVYISSLSATDLGLALPAGYDILGGVDINLSGATAASAPVLSIPTAGGDVSRVVIARIISAGAQRVPKIIARAIEENGRLRSITAAPALPAGVTLPGIREGGVYAFIRVPVAFGYINGIITDNNAPAVNVKVNGNRTPFADVTAADGRYLIIGAAGAAPAGQNDLSAAALTSDSTGAAQASLNAQDAVAARNIAIAPVALAVASISPAAATTNVSVTSPMTISFNKPVLPSTITASTLRLTTAAGNPVLGDITVLAGARTVVFTPAATLTGATAYKVTLTTGVLDLYSRPLAATFASTFTTAAPVPVLARVRAENIRISYPNAQGQSMISLPAGSVPAGATIIAINTASGATVSTVAGTAAIALSLLAQAGEEIELLIRQPDGVEYRLTQAAYRRADGFTAVGQAGGAITSDDGAIVLTVPQGAIAGQAEIKLTPQTEADIPLPRTGDMAPANFAFAAGVEIRAQGSFTQQTELHLELAAPAGTAEGRRAAFFTPAKYLSNGQQIDTWQVITSGKVENGRIHTTSPPFSGLFLGGGVITAWAMLPGAASVVYGRVVEKSQANSALQLPVKGAVCFSGDAGGAGRITALTSATGYCAVFNTGAMQKLTAYDPALNRTASAPVTPDSGVEQDFLAGLQGFITARANVVLPYPNGVDPATQPPQLSVKGFQTSLGPGTEDLLPTQGIAQLNATISIRALTDRPVEYFRAELIASGVNRGEIEFTNTGADADGRQTWTGALSGQTAAEGRYSLVIRARTRQASPLTETETTYNFLVLANAAARLAIPGQPPAVLSWSPPKDVTGVDVTTRIRLEFTEPVKNLIPGGTVYLRDLGTNDIIGGAITAGGQPVTSTTAADTILFTPARALDGGHRYELVVTTGVVDTDTPTARALDQQYGGPADTTSDAFRSEFSTLESLVLTPAPTPGTGLRVAIAGSYAVTIGVESDGNSMLRVYDVSDPRQPVAKGSLSILGRAVDLAVADDQTYATTTGINAGTATRIAAVAVYDPLNSARAVNVRLISLDDPAKPQNIGVASLYFPGTPPNKLAAPSTIQIQNRRVYVGNVWYRGVMAVDIEQSLKVLAASACNGCNAAGALSLALTRARIPGLGFGQEAVIQSAEFPGANGLGPATAVAVIPQEVGGASAQNNNPRGPMDVAWIADGGNRRLVAVGFPASLDGKTFLHDANTDGADDRILSVTDLPVEPGETNPDRPRRMRAVAGMLVGPRRIDLALLLGARRLWTYDISMSTGGQTIAPVLMASRTMEQLGFGATDTPGWVEIENGLAYVAFNNYIGVIDFSDPANPRGVGRIGYTGGTLGSALRGLAVRDGLVYSLSGGTGKSDGLNVSIARPSSRVFIHGLNPGSDFICANPIIVGRAPRLMKQVAVINFLVFGQPRPANPQVIIRRGETIIDTRSGADVTIDAATIDQVVSGSARWFTLEPILENAEYTAEIVLDGYATPREPIVFSTLINSYRPAFAARKLAAGADPSTFFRYPFVLAANANVQFRRVGNNALTLFTEQPGIGVNNLAVNTAGIPEGVYTFTLTAALAGDPAITDEVSGVMTISSQPADTRTPGHRVVAGVDLTTGNLGLSATDIDVKARGLNLTFARSYNSLASTSFNPLGYGWSHNYQVLLVRRKEKRADGTDAFYYQMQGGDGSGQQFDDGAPDASGFLRAKGNYHGRLGKNADGSLDFLTRAGVTYHFSAALDESNAGLFNASYQGNLDYIQDPNGNRLTLTRDREGRLARVTDASGQRALLFDYELAEAPLLGVLPPVASAAANLVCVPRGQFNIFRNSFIKTPQGRAWRIRAINTEGLGGLSLAYQYDDSGNLKKITRPGTDAISAAAVSAAGSPISHVWEYSYSPVVPAGVTPAGDVSHLLASATNPNGRRTDYQYALDQPGLPVAHIRYPESVTNSFERLGNGAEFDVTVRDGRGQDGNYVTTYHLVNGYVTRLTAPRNAVTQIEYYDETTPGSAGLEKRVTDPEGMVSEYQYDRLGNMTLRTMRGRNADVTTQTTTTWDTNFSKPILATDANGKATTYSLDARGNITLTTLPTGKSMVMEYLPNGDLLATTSERGLRTTYGDYDLAGAPRRINREIAPGSFETVTLSYDARGRVTSSQSDIGAHGAWIWDALDRVKIHESVDPAGIRDKLTTTSFYLPGGQLELARQSAPDSQTLTVRHTYDALDRLTALQESATGSAVVAANFSYAQSFAYDKNSNLIRFTDRRGVITAYEYDALNFRTSTTIRESD
ncbi:MAG: Ig-like domain-containing protein, partial [Blastocatellia bacterium]